MLLRALGLGSKGSSGLRRILGFRVGFKTFQGLEGIFLHSLELFFFSGLLCHTGFPDYANFSFPLLEAGFIGFSF